MRRFHPINAPACCGSPPPQLLVENSRRACLLRPSDTVLIGHKETGAVVDFIYLEHESLHLLGDTYFFQVIHLVSAIDGLSRWEARALDYEDALKAIIRDNLSVPDHIAKEIEARDINRVMLPPAEIALGRDWIVHRGHSADRLSLSAGGNLPGAAPCPIKIEPEGVRLLRPDGSYGPIHPLSGKPLKALDVLVVASRTGKKPDWKSADIANYSDAISKAASQVKGLSAYIVRPGKAGGGTGVRIGLRNPFAASDSAR